jgi:hypothetical protein
MACNTLTGRLVSCKDQVGGIVKAFFSPYDAEFPTTWSSTNKCITALNSNFTIHEFDLRPASSSFTSTINTDPASGSTAYEQVAELAFHKITNDDMEELYNLATGRFQAFILDANHNVHCMGYYWGAECSGGALVTGQARGDMSGFNMTITAHEPYNVMVKTSSGVPGTTDYPFDGLSGTGTLTIDPGTYPVI